MEVFSVGRKELMADCFGPGRDLQGVENPDLVVTLSVGSVSQGRRVLIKYPARFLVAELQPLNREMVSMRSR